MQEPENPSGLRSSGKPRPPKAPLAFRVGVVGHRPDRLQSADLKELNHLIRDILERVKKSVIQFSDKNNHLHSEDLPILRAISPLAEGSDRILADQAISLGFELSCPMPYVQEEYEKDFLPGRSQEENSLNRFRDLLASAEKNSRLVKFELMGNRVKEGDSYRNCAQVVMNQSDLLVVIWDGLMNDKPGGTNESLFWARAHNLPIIWIDAHSPHAWQFIIPGKEISSDKNGRNIPSGGKTDDIESVVFQILSLPISPLENHRDNDQLKRLLTYYNESPLHTNLALFWKFFRNLTGNSKLSFFSPRVIPFEVPFSGNKTANFQCNSTVLWLKSFFEWPDNLAEKFADRYRSGFIMTFLLASLAVGAALFPVIPGWLYSERSHGLTICMILESVIILLILGLVLYARKRQWHSRWLDYRMTAESVRQLSLFLPLGGGKPFPVFAGHLSRYGDPSSTWMTWYVQAIERKAGLPAARVDDSYLKSCLDQYAGLLKEQMEYHQSNAAVNLIIKRRLHRTGELTLWLTLICCLIHLSSALIPAFALPTITGNILVFLCGFLPALGAAMAGINHQGEFGRNSKSSSAMSEHLSNLNAEIDILLRKLSEEKNSQTGVEYSQVVDMGREIANLMINEVSDWKIVYQDRPPTLPA